MTEIRFTYGLVLLLVNLAFLAIVVVRMARDRERGSPADAIIAVVTCGIWALIWGWRNVRRHPELPVVMPLWTLLILGWPLLA